MINKDAQIVPEAILPPFTESEVPGFVPSTQMIRGDQLYYSPTKALTATVTPGTAISTGDAPTNAILENMRTRQNEIEARLKTLGLLKT